MYEENSLFQEKYLVIVNNKHI